MSLRGIIARSSAAAAPTAAIASLRDFAAFLSVTNLSAPCSARESPAADITKPASIVISIHSGTPPEVLAARISGISIGSIIKPGRGEYAEKKHTANPITEPKQAIVTKA